MALKKNNKAKEFSEYVKKNFTPILTQNAKRKIQEKFEINKEKEKRKAELIKKIEANKKKNQGFLKESIRIHKRSRSRKLDFQRKKQKSIQNKENIVKAKNSEKYKDYLQILRQTRNYSKFKPKPLQNIDPLNYLDKDQLRRLISEI